MMQNTTIQRPKKLRKAIEDVCRENEKSLTVSAGLTTFNCYWFCCHRNFIFFPTFIIKGNEGFCHTKKPWKLFLITVLKIFPNNIMATGFPSTLKSTKEPLQTKNPLEVTFDLKSEWKIINSLSCSGVFICLALLELQQPREKNSVFFWVVTFDNWSH